MATSARPQGEAERSPAAHGFSLRALATLIDAPARRPPQHLERGAKTRWGSAELRLGIDCAAKSRRYRTHMSTQFVRRYRAPNSP